MEFLETIETVRAEDATVQKLFGNEGVSARSGQSKPGYSAKLAEAAKFLGELITGNRPGYHLREALGTSDFPLLFGDLLDRQLFAQYSAVPPVWKEFTKVGSVNDFRTVKRFGITGAETALSLVHEQEEYPAATLAESTYSMSVKKYGRRMAFSWEAIINDDLQALQDIPKRMGQAAARTESRAVTGLYIGTAGPSATMFTVGNLNIITGNPVLSIAALQTAMTQLASKLDSDGEPIFIEAVKLVVPPALEIVARNILNSVQLYVGAVGDGQLVSTNWMQNRVQLVVDPYIPLLATTNKNTSWFLFPSTSVGRPALELAYLRGHEKPEVFIMAGNAQRVGGGGADPMSGSFATDTIEYKVRTVFGAAIIDATIAMASNGTNVA